MENDNTQRVYIARVILAVVVILALLFTLIWFLFIRDDSPAKNAQSKTETTQKRAIEAKNKEQVAKSTEKSKAGSTTSSSINEAARERTTSSATAPGSSSTTTPSTDASNLANTGPGEVVGLFLLTVIAATTAKQLHYRSAARHN
jgi:hypothetical protein